MNTVDQFVEQKAISRGGVSLFSKEDAMRFIEICREQPIRLLGIDGFLLNPDEKVQPSMEDSVDFSSPYYYMKTDSLYTDAIEFLRSRNDSLFFEIVYEEESA